MTRTLRLVFIAAVAMLAAGCGSSSGGSGTDTAKLAPPASFFYAEVNIDPSGSQEAAMRSILGDLPGSGPPEERLSDVLEKASKSETGSKVDFRQDVQPWLGDKAGVFVASPRAGSKDTAWAVVVATTDEGKAQETIDKGKAAGDRDASYNGTDYVVDKDGDAMAVVDGFFVAGSEAGLKQAIDANKGESLSEGNRYRQATDGVEEERIALLYEDFSGIVQALASASGESLGPVAPLIGGLFGGKPVVATIKVEQQALVVDGSLFPSSGLNLLGKSTELLGDVPADSWLALGQSDFGATVKTLFSTFAGFAGGEEQLEAQVQRASGLDLDRDVFSWIGDVAIFVNGDSAESIGGGVLIQSKDQAASRRALTKLSALAAQTGDVTVSAADVGGAKGYKLANESAPRGVFMLQSGDKVAIVYGEDAAKQALSGSGGGLASAPGFTDAAAKLGDTYAPALYLSVPPILRVAESFGASESSDYQQAKPYLTILDYVISGSARSGDGAASRTRIGFKPNE